MWWAGEIDASRFAAEIIENAGEGIVVYDRELRCLLWNRFMGELFGPPAGEVFPHSAEIERAMQGDTVARVGGDEFTIVLQDLEKKEDAAIVAQKVLHAIAEPIDLDNHRLYATTSIGITVFPDDGADAETLLKNADNAVYRAKAEG